MLLNHESLTVEFTSEASRYNLAGQQYAVAGTIAGLKALKADSDRRVAEYGGKPAFTPALIGSDRSDEWPDGISCPPSRSPNTC